MALQNLTLRDFEKARWTEIPDLKGMIMTMAELYKLFPPEGNLSGITVLEKGPKYIIFGREKQIGTRSISQPLAYLCNSCSNIYMGPPEIRDLNTMGTLFGKEGYALYCPKDHMFKEVTYSES
jgi:hypothetical protein